MDLEKRTSERKNLCFHFDSVFGDSCMPWIENFLKNPDTEMTALGFCEHYPYKLPIDGFVDGEFVCVAGENYRLTGESFFSTPNYFIHINIWEYVPTKKVGPAKIWGDRIVHDYSFDCSANRNVWN